MTVTTHEDLHSPQMQQDGTPRRATSPWLWVALIVAMFAAALLWLRYSGPDEVAPAPVGERMLPATEQTPVAETAPPAARQATPATSERKAVPAVRNREARPLASNSKPDYPAAALRNGVQGSVIASLDVDTRGNVTNAAIVSRSGERSRDLDRAVLRTVQNWKFQPAMQDGRAVASVVRVPVDFRTEQR
ncbi:TonB family protein [Stenotrophomonas maltophilia]|mgnify:FL=1|jgi:protein TonB|uniref:energy transducer TonB n=1 Tax=Stenotrophomonas TaxID=40323 RepID=UPI0006AC7E34|nr:MULTISPECIES: energy transducer TonB [Stenotrophomonas]KOQ71678.1 TonB-dependent receptor [Stenotrophomonas maltophilia]MBA0223372.1 energy transducer TonB [Stenotrophomonas maltophilia]MBH1593231.1 energy transducer TonB [Stenotrophomonas maltophilia]MCO7400309.1 TonB family protein [Stenotrophomonas maltophilia]MCO7411010.1 TonB family protein [Stenotrophomonas maltophilia]